MIVVGSRALHYYNNCDYKDIDIIATNIELDFLEKFLKPDKIKIGLGIKSLIGIKQNIIDGFNFDRSNIEILLADESPALIKYYNLNSTGLMNIDIANIETLYSLKKSHIYFPIKFQKHISPYLILHDKMNGVDILSDITNMNKKETEERLGKLKTPKLNKSTKEFFGQSEKFVKSYFIHDDIHKAVAYNLNHPVYEKLQKDEDSVWCSKDLWEKLEYDEKLYCVLEEAMVISLERKILPCLYGGRKYWESEKSLKWSLMRICTTLCSGYFREFALHNYNNLIDKHNPNYVEDFLKKVENKDILMVK